jgi:ribosomal protein L18
MTKKYKLQFEKKKAEVLAARALAELRKKKMNENTKRWQAAEKTGLLAGGARRSNYIG